MTVLEQEGNGMVAMAFMCHQSPAQWPVTALGGLLLPFSQGHGQLARSGLPRGAWIAVWRNNLTISVCYLLRLD